MIEFTDEQLIVGIRDRKDEVFKYLSRKYKHGIKMMVIEMGGNYTDGEDAFSEGIITLIEIVCKPDFKLTCQLSTLLYSVCKKKWLQVLDKNVAAQNYQVRHNESTLVEDFSEDVDDSLYHRIFWEAFKQLGKECRQILKAYWKEMPAKEIAELFEFTYGTIRKKKSICHTSLVKLIDLHPDVVTMKEKENFKIEL